MEVIVVPYGITAFGVALSATLEGEKILVSVWCGILWPLTVAYLVWQGIQDR